MGMSFEMNDQRKCNSSTNAARLVYRDVETNGAANINCRVGSVVLWFNPDWSSQSAGGSGPGDAGRFIELGSYGPTNSASTNDWWALLMSSDGNSLSFCTETNGALTTNVTQSICWTNNTWHQIVLVYNSTASGLYVDCPADGFPTGWGTGVAYWPSKAVRDQVICVGSDASGTQQIRGVLADLETYNYPLSSGEVQASLAAVETGGAVYDISFSTRYTSNAAVTASIAGPPSESMAILVSSTNWASNWVPFNANPTVNLGTGDGLKTVNFYFNSLSNLVSCYSLQLWLDTTPPAITITSPGPGTNTVNQPILQLQGYAPEELASVTYDLTNSAGWLTNQPAVVLSRYYDTNLDQFTTNTFQAFDLDLTLGANQITLHAKDLAGNVTTTNLTYTLDYSSKTNPPVLALYWPTNGAVLSGTNFTWRGWVDDPTVTLSAQIEDSNGDTNVLNGVVERNGNFWVENLPLALGTNWLTLTASDACTNVSVTNIEVVESSVNVTFTSVPDITNQTVISVTGTINTNAYAVWVNGVRASIDSNGIWTADNVPVNGIGTAVLQARAIPLTNNNGNGTGGGGGTNSTLQDPGNPDPPDYVDAETDPDLKPAILCKTYTLTNDILWTDAAGNTNHALNVEHWALNSPGDYLTTTYSPPGTTMNGWMGTWSPTGGFEATKQLWDMFGNGSATTYYSTTDQDYTNPTGLTGFTMDTTGESSTPEESKYNYSIIALPDWNIDFVYPNPVTPPVHYTVQHSVVSSYILQTGGKATSHRQSVFQLRVTAQNMGNLATPWPAGVWAPYNQITVMGQPLGNDYNYFVTEPDGIQVPVPVDVPCSPSFTFNITPTKYQASICANGTQLDPLKPQPAGQAFCVGQQVHFALSNTAPYVLAMAHWNLAGKYYNAKNYPNPNGSPHYFVNSNLLYNMAPPGVELGTSCWYVNGTNETVSVTVTYSFTNGQTATFPVSGLFNIYRPYVYMTANDITQPRFFTISTGSFGGATVKLGSPVRGKMSQAKCRMKSAAILTLAAWGRSLKPAN